MKDVQIFKTNLREKVPIQATTKHVTVDIGELPNVVNNASAARVHGTAKSTDTN